MVWEYRMTPHMDVESMRAYGKHGWELVTVIQEQLPGAHPRTTLYWKRKLP